MLRLTVVKPFAAACVLASALAGCGGAGGADVATDVPRPSAHPSPESSALQGRPPRTGPLGDGGATASCVEGYSTATVGNRAFAFDGTVVAVGPGGTDVSGKGSLDTVAVRFRVHEWFEGGTDETVTVDLMSPTSDLAGDETPAYEDGTRLLVSGEPRWGGPPLHHAIAWSCGFTRYYEATVADAWRRGSA